MANKNLKCPPGTKLKRQTKITTIKKQNGNTTIKKNISEKCVKKLSIKLTPGNFGKFGYTKIKNLSQTKRVDALKKAVKELGYKPVKSRLVLLRTFSKSKPELYKIYDNDIKKISSWVSKERKNNPDLYKTDKKTKYKPTTLNKRPLKNKLKESRFEVIEINTESNEFKL